MPIAASRSGKEVAGKSGGKKTSKFGELGPWPQLHIYLSIYFNVHMIGLHCVHLLQDVSYGKSLNQQNRLSD